LFYAARMRRQLDDNAGADQLFTAALPLAPDAVQRDACIWYILDNAVSLSPASAVPLLRRYAPSWSSAASFTDFMDRLCGRLVAEKDWPSLLEAFRTVRTVADSATIARYAYVIGRAVSLGYIGASRPLELLDRSTSLPSKPVLDPAETARRFFRIAFESDSASFYYRCLAASHLGENVDPIPAEERMNDFDQFAASRTRRTLDPAVGRIKSGAEKFSIGEAAEDQAPDDELAFLLNFFTFGCADFAMSYAQAAAPRLDPPEISSLAEAFAASGRWGDSVRFVSQLQKRPGYRLDRRDIQLLYPQPFLEEIGGAAGRWGVSEPLFYGLVRTESAFIPTVVSHAGAVGLAQLMPKTAADVASRIRTRTELRFLGDEVDLSDPATNANLGAWYLADMTRRGGSPLMALLSYNGGPTRVRGWRAAEKSLPEDLFLETIPVAETRDYGRKVLAAAAVYGYLYYGMTLERVVADIFPK
jgi:soluble lytic murein transglycosylase